MQFPKGYSASSALWLTPQSIQASPRSFDETDSVEPSGCDTKSQQGGWSGPSAVPLDLAAQAREVIALGMRPGCELANSVQQLSFRRATLALRDQIGEAALVQQTVTQLVADFERQPGFDASPLLINLALCSPGKNAGQTPADMKAGFVLVKDLIKALMTPLPRNRAYPLGLLTGRIANEAGMFEARRGQALDSIADTIWAFTPEQACAYVQGVHDGAGAEFLRAGNDVLRPVLQAMRAVVDRRPAAKKPIYETSLARYEHRLSKLPLTSEQAASLSLTWTPTSSSFTSSSWSPSLPPFPLPPSSPFPYASDTLAPDVGLEDDSWLATPSFDCVDDPLDLGAALQSSRPTEPARKAELARLRLSPLRTASALAEGDRKSGPQPIVLPPLTAGGVMGFERRHADRARGKKNKAQSQTVDDPERSPEPAKHARADGDFKSGPSAHVTRASLEGPPSALTSALSLIEQFRAAKDLNRASQFQDLLGTTIAQGLARMTETELSQVLFAWGAAWAPLEPRSAGEAAAKLAGKVELRIDSLDDAAKVGAALALAIGISPGGAPLRAKVAADYEEVGPYSSVIATAGSAFRRTLEAMNEKARATSTRDKV